MKVTSRSANACVAPTVLPKVAVPVPLLSERIRSRLLEEASSALTVEAKDIFPASVVRVTSPAIVAAPSIERLVDEVFDKSIFDPRITDPPDPSERRVKPELSAVRPPASFTVTAPV